MSTSKLVSAQGTPRPCTGEPPAVSSTCCERECGYCATTRVRESNYCDLHTPCACAECQRARNAETQYRAPALAAENGALRKALADARESLAWLRMNVYDHVAPDVRESAGQAIDRADSALSSHPARGEDGVA